MLINSPPFPFNTISDAPALAFVEITGVPIIDQMTGKSFKKQLLSSDQGRIDLERNHTLLGKERHDIGRVEGDQYSLAYPARAIRTDEYLYFYRGSGS